MPVFPNPETTEITVFCEGSDQRLWIGTNSGFWLYDGEILELVELEGVKRYWIYDIIQKNEQELLIATDFGLFKYDLVDHDPVKYPEFGISPVYYLSKVSQSIWAGGRDGIFALNNDQWEIQRETALRKGTSVNIGSKAYWISEEEIWTLEEEGQSMRTYIGSWLHKPVPTKVLDIGMPQVILNSFGQFSLIGNNQYNFYSLSNEIVGFQPITCGLQTLGGKWLFGSERDGLIFWDGQNFVKYGLSNGLSTNHIDIIEPSKNGGYWIGGSGGFWYHLMTQTIPFVVESEFRFISHFNSSVDGNTLLLLEQQINKNEYLLYSKTIDSQWHKKLLVIGLVSEMTATKDGTVVLLQKNKLLFNRNEITWEVSLPENHNYKNLRIHGQSVFMSSDNSILEIAWNYDVDNDVTINRNEYLVPNGKVKNILIDKSGGLLALDYKGRLSNPLKDDFDWFIPKAENNDVLIENFIFGKDGKIWMKSKQGNFIYFSQDIEEAKFLKIKSNKEILKTRNDKSSGFSMNQEGLWFTTPEGLVQIRIDNNYEVIGVNQYGPKDGFSPNFMSANLIPELINSKAFYISSRRRVFSWQKVEDKAIDYPPRLRIDKVMMLDREVPISTLEKLRFNHDRIEVSFVGNHLLNRGSVLYSWKLHGRDESWSAPTKQRFCVLSGIAPGEYVLEIKAALGQTNDRVQVPINVAYPFWQELKYQLLIGVLLIFMFFLSAWLMNRRIMRRLQAKNDKLENEKKLLLAERKSLQLQMNPHFIFNLLNTAQGKLDSVDARRILGRFSTLMRNFLDHSRRKSVSLDEVIESIERYLALERDTGGGNFEYKICFSRDLETEMIKIPPLLLQPFVENAIIHGIKNIEHKGLINIFFKEKEGYLYCKIEDNGRGRKAAAKLKSQLDTTHKSHALNIVQERLELIDNSSKIDVIDKMIDGEVHGTIVSLKIKILDD